MSFSDASAYSLFADLLDAEAMLDARRWRCVMRAAMHAAHDAVLRDYAACHFD